MIKNIKIVLTLFFVFTCSLTCSLSWGQGSSLEPTAIQVIVNVQSELTLLNRKQVMSLFLGRARSFPNGKSTKAFDYQIGSQLRKNFFEWLTGKSISDIDAYWARLRYSGRTSPPKVITDMNTILNIVAQNQSAIAYTRLQDPEHLARLGIVVVHTINGM